MVAINMSVPAAAGQDLPAALASIGRAAALIDKPAVFVATAGKTLTDYTREAIAEHGLPHIVTGIDDLLRAFKNGVWWSGEVASPGRRLLLQQALQGEGPRPRTERSTLDYLAAAGVPVIPAKVVTSPADAASYAATLNAAAVLKIASPDIAHKTEVGGVRLNVSPCDVKAATESILADVARLKPDAGIDGIIVSPMRGSGLELLVGVSRDPCWGLMLTLGFGGTLVELLTDAVTAPLPVDRTLVVEMLRRLRGAKLFDGYRGSPAADLDKIAEVIVRIADAAAQLGPDLQALEVNPLLIAEQGPEALDALAIW